MSNYRVPYLSEFNRGAVYRASSLFWAVVSDTVETSIEFMNYWSFKHGARQVGLIVTVLDRNGAVVIRRGLSIGDEKAYSIRASDLLNEAGATRPFEGSIHIEILAGVDLKFAYPALLVVYSGPRWQAVAHTYTRSLATASGDTAADLTEPRTAEESNWIVADDDDHFSFVVLHNGPFAAEEEPVELEIYNDHGERLELKLALPARDPGATTVLAAGDHADVRTFLGGRPGWAIARFAVRGIFPRLLAGHRRRSDGAIVNLAHSHFNSRNDPSTFALDSSPPPKPMFISVPIAANLPWQTSLVAYPTFRPLDADLEVAWIDAGGKILGSKRESIAEWSGVDDRRALFINPNEGAPRGVATADITLQPRDKHIPSRFHLGVRFDTGRGMPATFTTGFASFRKPRYSTYWVPLTRLAGRNEIMSVINTDVGHDTATTCEMDLTLYRTQDVETLSGRLKLPPNGTFTGPIEEIIPEAPDFLQDEPGWCVIRVAQSANLHVFFAIVDRESGCIAADHAF
jgi:hypothetical protein